MHLDPLNLLLDSIGAQQIADGSRHRSEEADPQRQPGIYLYTLSMF